MEELENKFEMVRHGGILERNRKKWIYAAIWW